MAWKIFNIGKANAEIEAAHTALSAAMQGVTTVKVGKDDIAIADAPLSAKIVAALAAAQNTASDAQKLADAIATNEQLSADLTAANASVASLDNDKTALNATISELTGKLSDANKLELDQKTALRTHLAALPGHADYKDGGSKAGASLAELITAEINATNAALAATGVKLDSIPAPGGSGSAPAKPQTYTERCLAAKKTA